MIKTIARVKAQNIFSLKLWKRLYNPLSKLRKISSNVIFLQLSCPMSVNTSHSWASTQLPNGWRRDLNTQRFLIQSLYLQKGIRTECPDAPSDGFVSHGQRGRYKSVGLLLGIWRLPSSSCKGSYIVLGVLFLSLMARRYFMFVMMTFGGSMVIATLLAAVRNCGR